METIVVIFLVLFVVYILYQYSNQSTPLLGGAIPVSNVLSHWSHSFRSFVISSDLFYGELEKTLQEHEMPHSKIERTKHKEGGLLSASRVYLRIKHGDIVFDVCASPFGRDFFISWWLYETAGTMRTLLKNTKVGNFLTDRATKRTFYQIDEEDMFRSCVHECILHTITKVTEGKGITQLTDSEKAFRMGGL
ncbi:MAG: hypothetical protein JWQ09_5983 [Segetibacter sp.]|nr:hypothetical protein [Segetibacter sp.]